MKWKIVGFNHPENPRSLIYCENITTATLHKKIDLGISKGCNLFSIRGFSDGDKKGDGQ